MNPFILEKYSIKMKKAKCIVLKKIPRLKPRENRSDMVLEFNYLAQLKIISYANMRVIG